MLVQIVGIFDNYTSQVICHCVKSVRIRNYSGPYSVRMQRKYIPEKLRIQTLFTLCVIVFARCRVQYGEYFPSFSNFATYFTSLQAMKVFVNIARGNEYFVLCSFVILDGLLQSICFRMFYFKYSITFKITDVLSYFISN